jgi:hypothetical protein
MSDETVPIQVTVPGADPAADALLRVGAAAGKLGDSVGAAKPKVEGADASLRKIAESSKASEKLLGELSKTGNAAFQSLTEKAGQFAKATGDSVTKGLGDLAEVGVKSLAAFGPWGIAATAAIGLIGIMVTATQTHEKAQRDAAAQSAELASVNERLGGTYASVRGAIDATKSAEENINAVRAAGLAILQQQLTLLGQGYSTNSTTALTAAFEQLHAAQVRAYGSAGALTVAQLQQIAATGNAEQQLRVFGVAMAHSADATRERVNQEILAAQALAHTAESERDRTAAAERAAVAALATARAQARANAGALDAEAGNIRVARALDATTAAHRAATAASAAATAARAAADRQTEELTRRTASLSDAEKRLADERQRGTQAIKDETAAGYDQLNMLDSLGEADKALADRRQRDAEKVRRMAQTGSTAAEIRASIEALRAARAANDNVGREVGAPERQAQALAALTFAQNEVRIAQERVTRATRAASAAVTENMLTVSRGHPAHQASVAQRAALTAALQAQTAAQEHLNAVGEAEAAAARTRAQAVEAETAALERNNRAKAEAALLADNGGMTARERDAQAESNLAGKGAEQSRLNRLAEERAASLRIRTFFSEQAAAAIDLRRTVEDAYGGMTAAAGAHFSALVLGQETAGAAASAFVHDSTEALAKIAAQQSVFEFGKGLASLFLNPAEATAHFGASVVFGLVAAGSGAVAQATSVAPPAAAAGGLPASSEPRRASPVSASDRASGEGGTVINVSFGGPVIGAGGARQVGRYLAEQLNAAHRQGGVTLAPGLLRAS